MMGNIDPTETNKIFSNIIICVISVICPPPSSEHACPSSKTPLMTEVTWSIEPATDEAEHWPTTGQSLGTKNWQTESWGLMMTE